MATEINLRSFTSVPQPVEQGSVESKVPVASGLSSRGSGIESSVPPGPSSCCSQIYNFFADLFSAVINACRSFFLCKPNPETQPVVKSPPAEPESLPQPAPIAPAAPPSDLSNQPNQIEAPRPVKSWDHFPTALLEPVCQYLKLEEIPHVQRLCTAFNRAAKAPVLWKALGQRVDFLASTHHLTSYETVKACYLKAVQLAGEVINQIAHPRQLYVENTTWGQDLRRIVRAEKALFAEYLDQFALCGFPDLVSLLVVNSSVSQKHRERAVGLAAGEGFLPIVLILLQTGPISDNQRFLAITIPAQKGYLLVIRALLESGPISECDRVKAITLAVKNGHLPVVQELLKNASINDVARGILVRKAADNGHPLIAEALLKHGPIRDTDRVIALIIAAKRGLVSTILLLDNKSISEDARGRAAVAAAQKGHLPVIQELFKNAFLFNKYRKQAFQYAMQNGHEDVAYALLRDRLE